MDHAYFVILVNVDSWRVETNNKIPIVKQEENEYFKFDLWPLMYTKITEKKIEQTQYTKFENNVYFLITPRTQWDLGYQIIIDVDHP